MDFSREWKYLQQVSEKRLLNNKTSRHVSKYGEEIELIGAVGELAARRFLGLPQSLHETFDHGVDLIWRGKAIDVKATHLTPKIMYRFLQWPEWKTIKADIVLMTAVNLYDKSAVVLGFAYARELMNAEVNNEREIPCHEIAVPKLHPPYLLIAPGRL